MLPPLSGDHAPVGMQEVQTHPHHLPGQDGVCGRVLVQEHGRDVLQVLQGLGWQPVVSQEGGVEQLVHLGRGRQSSRGWEQGEGRVCGCPVLWHITPPQIVHPGVTCDLGTLPAIPMEASSPHPLNRAGRSVAAS